MANTNIATDIQPLLGKERVLRHPTAKKQNNRPTMLIIMAVVVLVAIGLAKNIFKPNATSTVLVVGAQKDLLPGTRIGYTSCHYLQIPKAYVNAGMMDNSQKAVGRVVKYFIPMGEPITDSVLYSGRDTMSANFENHERAITLALDDDALLDHAINPGDTVDILTTVARNGQKYTKTIGQNIKVLMAIPQEALGSNAIRANERNHITLAATPQLSELLTEAKEVGKIHLVLRNRLSIKEVDLTGANERDLLPANLTEEKTSQLAQLPSLEMLPPPPPTLPSLADNTQTKNSGAIGWIVDVFMGGKKETISVPAQ